MTITADDKNGIELVRRGYDEPTRNLHFRVGFYNAEAAAEAADLIGGYNEFDGGRAAAAIRLLAPEIGFSLIEIGREGSPVIYIRTADKYIPTIMFTLRDLGPDELDVQGSTVRAWWD